jgi:hypothetical protein
VSVRQLIMPGFARRAGDSSKPPSRVKEWLRSPLRRLEWLLDESQMSRSSGATRIRLVVGSLFVAYGLALEAIALDRGHFKISPLWFLVGSLPIFLNRLGRFGRYFLPVILGFYAYGVASSYAAEFKLDVHYVTQIKADELLGAGSIPTIWLQAHLYRGTTGPLEVFCLVAYIGHFFVPLGLGIVLALMNRAREFRLLMFSLLAVLLMGTITFMVAPTAPPWLAAQNGYLGDVHHILKQTLASVHLDSVAAMEGDASRYDITAAAPSLHAAFPFICLLVAIRARLPRAVTAFLAADVLSVVFAIVYMGEHYVFDAVVGLVYGLVAVSLVRAATVTGGRTSPTSAPASSPGSRR